MAAMNCFFAQQKILGQDSGARWARSYPGGQDLAHLPKISDLDPGQDFGCHNLGTLYKILGKCWQDLAQVLSKCWASLEQVLASLAQVLSKSWASVGQVLLCKNFLLGLIWTVAALHMLITPSPSPPSPKASQKLTFCGRQTKARAHTWYYLLSSALYFDWLKIK